MISSSLGKIYQLAGAAALNPTPANIQALQLARQELRWRGRVRPDLHRLKDDIDEMIERLKR